MSACLGKISKISKLIFGAFGFLYTCHILPCALCMCSSHTQLLHKAPFKCAVSLSHFIAHRLQTHSCSLKCTKHIVNSIQKFGEKMGETKEFWGRYTTRQNIRGGAKTQQWENEPLIFSKDSRTWRDCYNYFVSFVFVLQTYENENSAQQEQFCKTDQHSFVSKFHLWRWL